MELRNRKKGGPEKGPVGECTFLNGYQRRYHHNGHGVCIDHTREADFFCACCVIIIVTDGIFPSIQTFNSFRIVVSFPLCELEIRKK